MDISLTTIRMFVHILAATIWVGGQLVMAGLVPVARTVSADAPRILAKRFAMVSWPAFLILTFTGIWNALSIDFGEASSSYKAKFGLKMTCYLITGFGAALHSFGPTVGRTKPKLRVPMLAIGGAASSLGALGVLFFAVALKY
jgi:putative copper export protein